MSTIRNQLQAVQDQEWAKAVEWYDGSDVGGIMAMRAKLIRADALEASKAMTPAELDIAFRLADLALAEVVMMSANGGKR